MTGAMIDAFAGYRFHRVLGDGSFEATEVDSGDRVVVESAVGAGEDDLDLREWFAEAWETLAGLEHPCLPDVRDRGEQDGMPFAVRAPADGPALDGLDPGASGLDATSARVIACRLADGLERAHDAGVVHGDLGPRRVVLQPPGEGGERVAIIVGFGRVEGLRSDDVRALGEVIDALAAATPAPSDEEAREGDGAVDTAVLAMLARVASEARDGSMRRAGDVRDAIAAGSGGSGAGRRGLRSRLATAVRGRRGR